MCPPFTVLKKGNHCYLSSERVAYKKNIEQRRLETNTASKKKKKKKKLLTKKIKIS